MNVKNAIFFIFILVLIIDAIAVISGIPFVIIEETVMSFVLIILFPILAILTGIIAAYSAVAFKLERRYRDLILLLMSINIMVIGLLYLITNAALTPISPFADNIRNRTIVTGFGLILAPFTLIGSVTNRVPATKRQTSLALIWGAIITPGLVVWFFLSPEPLFQTRIVSGGLTPIGIVIIISYFSTMLYACYRYLKTWFTEGNELDLAAALAMGLWMLALSLIALQTSPLQIMEIVWYSTFIVGTFLVLLVSVSSAVVEPQRILRSLVFKRTEQLNQSRKESEFYLNQWGHKIGNLLQAMMTYLELLKSESKGIERIQDLSNSALEIGRETNLINTQVAALIRIKNREESSLEETDLRKALIVARSETQEAYEEAQFSDTSILEDVVFVSADDMLSLAFSSIFSYLCKKNQEPKITVIPERKTDGIDILVKCKGAAVANDVKQSFLLDLQPDKTTLSLDLFIAKILFSRYNVEITMNREEGYNILNISFTNGVKFGNAYSIESVSSEASIHDKEL